MADNRMERDGAKMSSQSVRVTESSDVPSLEEFHRNLSLDTSSAGHITVRMRWNGKVERRISPLPPAKRVKMVALGAAGVGKTTVVQKLLGLCHDVETPFGFPNMYQATMWRGDRRQDVEILDSAGAWSLEPVREILIANALIFLLVYSPGDPESFNEVIRCQKQIVRMPYHRLSPIVVVANCMGGGTAAQHEKATAAAEELVTREWGQQFRVVSAVKGRNMTQLYVDIFRLARKVQNTITHNVKLPD